MKDQQFERRVPLFIFTTSSNHRLEAAGLNALEELLFKMLGMGSGRGDSNECLTESVTENWRYFRLSPNLDALPVSFVKLAN